MTLADAVAELENEVAQYVEETNARHPRMSVERALETLVRSVTALTQALRASDSRRDSAERDRHRVVIERLDELQQASIALLVAAGKGELAPKPKEEPNGKSSFVLDDKYVTARFTRDGAAKVWGRARPYVLAALTGAVGWLARHTLGTP